MIERNLATWLARKNGLPADQIEDLIQESALADLQGDSGKNAAERLAKRLARRQASELASELPASQPIDTASELAELLPASELAFAIAVMSGELSRHDGTVSRRFSRILEMARSNSAKPIPSMV